MVVKEVWITRHGFREDWVNENPHLPTNRSNDPTLSSLGRQQAQELKDYLKDKSIDRIYSSPFYRVLETVYPLAQESKTPLFIDNSMSEWYGLAHGKYLSPASLSELKQLFPQIDTSHTSSIPIPVEAETEKGCHVRVKDGLDKLLSQLDSQDVNTVLLAGHAASVICAVRALLTQPTFPVRSGTCSLARLVRRDDLSWEIVENGNCQHLNQGEQRSWAFSGDVPDYEQK